jgi:hypothetical protein
MVVPPPLPGNADRQFKEEPEQIDQLEEVELLEEVGRVQEPSIRRHLDPNEQDDRPQPKRKRRRSLTGDGPWLVAIDVACGSTLVAFVLSLFFGGPDRSPASYASRLVTYGFGCFAGLLLIFPCVICVKYKWYPSFQEEGKDFHGPLAVLIGLLMTLFGGLLTGSSLYLFLETLLRGQ